MKVNTVDWKLIGHCNLKCLHCYGPPKTQGALPLDKLFGLVKKFKKLDSEWIVITGGEPTLLEGLEFLMADIRKRGMKVALSTNTSFFWDHYDYICKYVNSLNIPIDGSTPEIHALSRCDTRSFHTFFEVLNYFMENRSSRPKIRVGTVYSAANVGDLLEIAKKLERFFDIIDTWKIYEVMDVTVQRDLRQPILLNDDVFEKETLRLLSYTKLRSKIALSPAASRDKAFFLVNPQGIVVVPTRIGRVTHDVVAGDLLQDKLHVVYRNWQEMVNGPNFDSNHRKHYEFSV